ncbi:ATP-dependent endonuclease [Vibrio splendidus]
MTNYVSKATALPIQAFDKYILDIRFPHFKKIKPNSQINFTSPFTVLVGPNGSGKSSTLQAMYGAPKGYSVGKFWFSTALDPIVESGDDINRFIYRYKVKGLPDTIEILKTRTRRKERSDTPENPDYWEPAKPNVKDNMSTVPAYSEKYAEVMTKKGKWSPIEKPVVYIDFRSELSAFDKFFYFGQYSQTKTIHKKQDFLRKFSKILSSHLTKPKSAFPIKWGRRKRSKSVYVLTSKEIQWVNKILGKSYHSAKIVKHNLFNNDGYSIIFTEQGHSYSEAVAGSGEVSVVNCVTQALQAADFSLILLDEPEVSLHPGAQKELRNLLCHVIVEKKCQVVMSTHSEHFVHGLPNNAIKLFQYDSVSSSYSILNECSPEQAFVRLGVSSSVENKNIYVEDPLAKLLVEEAINELDGGLANEFFVQYYPGGAKTLTKHLLINFAVANTESKSIVLLDGDENRSSFCEPLTSRDITPSDYDKIDAIMLEQTGIRWTKSESDDSQEPGVELPVNGGNSSNTEEKLKLKLRILDTYHDKFKFMNVDTPEEFIWKISEGVGPTNVNWLKDEVHEASYKQCFRKAVDLQFGESNADLIFTLQRAFLNQRNKEHPLWTEFKEQLKEHLNIEDLS